MEEKRVRRRNLSVKQKLELLEKLEAGVSTVEICKIYDIKKQTVSDIKRSKDRIRKYVLMHDSNTRKHMKCALQSDLEEAVITWFRNQTSNGVHVFREDLRNAASEIADDLNLDFKASNGWLWRFCKRHGILNNAKKPRKNINLPSETAQTTNIVNATWNEDNKEEIDDKNGLEICKKFTTLRSNIDNLISYVESSWDPEVQSHLGHLQSLKSIIVKKEKSESQMVKEGSSTAGSSMINTGQFTEIMIKVEPTDFLFKET